MNQRLSILISVHPTEYYIERIDSVPILAAGILNSKIKSLNDSKIRFGIGPT